MNIKFAGQMFFRKAFGFKNLYIVCGIVRSDILPANKQKLPESERVYTICGETIGDGESRKEAQGKGLDDIVKAPFWRVKDE